MKKLITCCVAGLIAISASATYAQTVVYQHTFDGVANDSTPALQILSNGVGDPLPMTDLSTGEIANIFNSASGFNTTAGIDLSDMNEFTIEFVVTNNYSGVEMSEFNGAFFGVVNSATANATDGTALYNNAGVSGTPIGVSIGLQIGPARGAAGPDFVLDQANGNGAFTQLFDPEVSVLDDETDGYSICITYANDAATGNTAVTIRSTGLATDFDFSTVAAVDYATLAANVTPNSSCQGGTLDLESITITDVPVVKDTLLVGDVNCDMAVDFLDIGPFINLLSTGGFLDKADIDGSGAVDFLDIGPFIALLSSSS